MKKPVRSATGMLHSTAAAIALIAVCGQAWAQEAVPEEAPAQQGDSVFRLGNVVVTATRKEENLNSVPVSVSAISDVQLEALGAQDIGDLQVTVPNFNVQAVVTRPNDPILVIRGLLKRDGDATLDTAVGVYTDDVFLARGYSVLGQLLDVDRVEVLRGPQGTLFGRNTIGGAVQVISNRPGLDGENDGYFKASAGSFDLIQFEGANTFPLWENAALRIAGKSVTRSGYTTTYLVDDTGPSGYQAGDPILETIDTNDENSQAYRVSFAWEPTPDTRLDLSAYHSQSDTNGVMSKGLSGDLGGLVPVYAGGTAACAPGGCATPVAESDIAGGDFYKALSDVRPNADSKVDIYIGRLEQDFGDLTAKFIVSHAQAESSSALNTDGIVGFNDDLVFDLPTSRLGKESHSFSTGDVEQTTLEAQLLGNFGDRVDWLLGLYYFEETANDFVYNPGDIGPSGPPVSIADVVAKNDSQSIYGGVTWALTDRLKTRVGGRYTEDNKNFLGRSRTLNQATGVAACAFNPALTFNSTVELNGYVDPACVLENTQSSENFTWDISLDYQLSEASFLYGKVATGYRTGGISLNANSPESAAPFKEDKILTYEIGLKQDIGDRAHVNLAVFYSDYQDVQQNVISSSIQPLGLDCAPGYAGAPVILTCNIGDAEIKGLEFDGVWRVTDNLTVQGTYGYTDLQFEGNYLPLFQPESSYSLSAVYDTEVFNRDLRATLSYQQSGEWFGGTTNGGVPQDFAKVDGYSLLNARLAYNLTDNTQIAVWGRNLLEDEYYSASVTVTNALFSLNSGVPGAPRMIGVDFKVEF